jgi:proteasome lid subunit RPN8/RPN11
MSELLSADLFGAVEDHVVSDVEREVGGVLVGVIQADRPSITAVIPALAAVGTSANVTFTQEVWEDIHQRIDRDFPGTQIVGWYHSHPGFGIFLSGYDLFIHENFFSAAGQVALVVDPLAGEAGWFGWRDGKVVETERFSARLVPGPAASARAEAAQQDVRKRWRNFALLGTPVAALAGFVAGQLILSSPEPVTDAPSATTEAEEREENGTNGERVGELETELAVERGRVLDLEDALEFLETDARAGETNSGNVDDEPPIDIGYTVSAGDSFWRIAERVYGNGEAWSQLAEANPSIDPDALTVGVRLRVPITVGEFAQSDD